MPPQLGKTLVILDLLLVVFGTLLRLGGGSVLGWFGRLPGDIRIERPGIWRCAAILSMLLVSVVLSGVLWQRLGK